eukprot:1465010-Heterocapsa_arctica.AAC.1
MERGSPATGTLRMNGVTVAQTMHKTVGVPTLSIPGKARYLVSSSTWANAAMGRIVTSATMIFKPPKK